ncbi:MAG: hypothetical protein NTZ35_01135 [Ignavibacteriales bacterium]|nr:hypothetical protein [Ignavibacteriales bacterium]
MSKIEAKLFLKIWEKIAQQEHLTDRGLSLKLGVTPSAVTHWRSGRTAFVMPGILDRLEKKLGYKVKFKDDGTWELRQIGEGRTTTQKTEEQWIAQRGRQSRQTLVWPVSRKLTVGDRGIGFGEWIRISPLEEYDLRRNIWVQMDDESMSPLVPKGSWLLVQKMVKPCTGELGLVSAKTSNTVMIGIVAIDKSRYQVNPTNGKPNSFKPEEILSAHRVLSIAFPSESTLDARAKNQRRALHQSTSATNPPAPAESQDE